MFLILADFLSTLGGGGRKDIYTGPATQGVACRYGIAVGLLTVRPGRYGKGRRAGLAEGLQGRSVRGRVGR